MTGIFYRVGKQVLEVIFLILNCYTFNQGFKISSCTFFILVLIDFALPESKTSFR